MKKIVLYAALLGIAITGHAQEVNTTIHKDSIDIKTAEPLTPPVTPLQPITSDFSVPLPDADASQPSIDTNALDVSKAVRWPSLARWDTGAIIGYNGMISSMNGFGYRSGAMMMQQWDRLTLTGNMSLSKDMINAIGVTNGISSDMQLMYRLGRNASLTAFGGISHYGWMSPSPSMTAAYYGGYMTLNTNNGKWAVDLGVRQVYNSMTGRWETVPIVMPYYNLGGAKLGFDFGGLIYDAVRSTRESVVNTKGSMEGRGPAIIAPPIDMKPKRLPTEVPKNMGNTGLK